MLPRKCAVNGCPTTASSTGEALYDFPNKKNLLLAWTTFCDRDGRWKPTKNSQMCAKHFTQSDIKNSSFTSGKHGRTLRMDACPTIKVAPTSNCLGCVVMNCKNYPKDTDSTIAYYDFPNDPELRRKWVEFCGHNTEWAPRKLHKICSEHFRGEDIEQITIKNKTMLKLKNRVIPSIKPQRKSITADQQPPTLKKKGRPSKNKFNNDRTTTDLKNRDKSETNEQSQSSKIENEIQIRCCVDNCPNNSLNVSSSILFHPFPSDQEQIDKWKDLCKKEKNWTPSEKSHVCSEHFQSNAFEIDPNDNRAILKKTESTKINKVIMSPSTQFNMNLTAEFNLSTPSDEAQKQRNDPPLINTSEILFKNSTPLNERKRQTSAISQSLHKNQFKMNEDKKWLSDERESNRKLNNFSIRSRTLDILSPTNEKKSNRHLTADTSEKSHDHLVKLSKSRSDLVASSQNKSEKISESNKKSSQNEIDRSYQRDRSRTRLSVGSEQSRSRSLTKSVDKKSVNQNKSNKSDNNERDGQKGPVSVSTRASRNSNNGMPFLERTPYADKSQATNYGVQLNEVVELATLDELISDLQGSSCGMALGSVTSTDPMTLIDGIDFSTELIASKSKDNIQPTSPPFLNDSFAESTLDDSTVIGSTSSILTTDAESTISPDNLKLERNSHKLINSTKVPTETTLDLNTKDKDELDSFKDIFSSKRRISIPHNENSVPGRQVEVSVNNKNDKSESESNETEKKRNNKIRERPSKDKKHCDKSNPERSVEVTDNTNKRDRNVLKKCSHPKKLRSSSRPLLSVSSKDDIMDSFSEKKNLESRRKVKSSIKKSWKTNSDKKVYKSSENPVDQLQRTPNNSKVIEVRFPFGGDLSGKKLKVMLSNYQSKNKVSDEIGHPNIHPINKTCELNVTNNEGRKRRRETNRSQGDGSRPKRSKIVLKRENLDTPTADPSVQTDQLAKNSSVNIKIPYPTLDSPFIATDWQICEVIRCRSNTYNIQNGVTYHPFPLNLEKRNQWMEFCKAGDDWKPQEFSRVCSRHFKNDDYANVTYNNRVKKVLKLDAVPSLHSGRTDSTSVVSVVADNGMLLDEKEIKEEEVDDEYQSESIRKGSELNDNSKILLPGAEHNSVKDKSIQTPIQTPPKIFPATQSINNDVLESSSSFFSSPGSARTSSYTQNETAKLRKKLLQQKALISSLYAKQNELKLEVENQAKSIKLLRKKRAIAEHTNRELEKKLNTMKHTFKRQSSDEFTKQAFRTKILSSPLGKSLTENQIDLLLQIKKKVRWTKKELSNAFTLRCLSKDCYVYDYLSSIYPLPGLHAIQRYAQSVRFYGGLLKDIFNIMSTMSKTFSPKDLVTVLIYDTIPVQAIIEYDPDGDEIIGPYDSMHIIMARGLFSDWKQIIYVDFDTNVTSSVLNNIISELHEIQFNVVAFVCDCSQPKLNLLLSLGVSGETTYFDHPSTGNKICCFFDFARLMEMMRNALITKGFTLMDGTEITKKPLIKLQESGPYIFADGSLFTPENLLSCTNADTLSSAMELFSSTISTLLRKLANDESKVLANFIDTMRKWFQVMSSLCIDGSEQSIIYFKDTEEQNAVLNNAYDLIKSLRCIETNRLNIFQEAILISIRSLQVLGKDMSVIYDDEQILGNKLSQNALDILNQNIRKKCNCNDDQLTPMNIFDQMRSLVFGMSHESVESERTFIVMEEQYVAHLAFESANLKAVIREKSYDDILFVKTMSMNSVDVVVKAIEQQRFLDHLIEFLIQKHRKQFCSDADQIPPKYAMKSDMCGQKPTILGFANYSTEMTEHCTAMETLFRDINKDGTLSYKTKVLENLLSKMQAKLHLHKDIIKSFLLQRILVRVKYLNLDMDTDSDSDSDSF